ncbi:MAG: adenylosuccinate lyase [Candidatus Daviesbacteria bacterium]|nr:adenylosuccinate lyase [Candidatus Daviesbacteria bacterium]
MKTIKKKNKMPTENSLALDELTAITTTDGRYRRTTQVLAPYVSEYALIKTRFEIEALHLIGLSEEGVVRKLSASEKKRLTNFADEIDLESARKVKNIEDSLRHDVKSMETAFRGFVKDTSLEDLTEMIHFGLTSEDINNLAYRLMLKRATQQVCLPVMDKVVDELVDNAQRYKNVPMLARTHGQAAVPTTVGKEFVVFAERLNNQARGLEQYKLRGKFGGAVGNMNSLQFAKPDVNWIRYSREFVKSLGFEPNLATTQINPYDDVVEYLQYYQRANLIILGLDQDMWRYISDYWFAQEKRSGEVGSSTMPQKVNPIDFENSEGNVQIANALIEGMVRKLEVSRLQRDLSDSTTIRNIGNVLAHSFIGYKSLLEGLSRVKLNPDKIAEDLNVDWSILSEAVQTYLRAQGYKDPYNLVATSTRGHHMGQEEWQEWVDGLDIDDYSKNLFSKLTPETYIGEAVRLTEITIEGIKRSKK